MLRSQLWVFHCIWNPPTVGIGTFIDTCNMYNFNETTTVFENRFLQTSLTNLLSIMLACSYFVYFPWTKECSRSSNQTFIRNISSIFYQTIGNLVICLRIFVCICMYLYNICIFCILFISLYLTYLFNYIYMLTHGWQSINKKLLQYSTKKWM